MRIRKLRLSLTLENVEAVSPMQIEAVVESLLIKYLGGLYDGPPGKRELVGSVQAETLNFPKREAATADLGYLIHFKRRGSGRLRTVVVRCRDEREGIELARGRIEKEFPGKGYLLYGLTGPFDRAAKIRGQPC